MISWIATPIQPRTTLPVFLRLSTISSAMLLGIANPIPSEPPVLEKMAVLMPINSPFMLTRAPPEFPGLIAASVWTKSS